jgi:hypothetical protein
MALRFEHCVDRGKQPCVSCYAHVGGGIRALDVIAVMDVAWPAMVGSEIRCNKYRD